MADSDSDSDSDVDSDSGPGSGAVIAGFGSSAYRRKETTMVATRPRPYSPTGLPEAGGPVNRSDVVKRSPAPGPTAHAATAARAKPPRYR